MGESTKQARLDNWAMFVMSRLQIFFNTTDYCDLTLQFEGNVQLKVHRVIMNACTEYFRLLEQECECMDGDVLIMPPDLQADVILPIVNFMYTGILEYHQSIYDRLYQTAELMNMTVLLKFLEAQRIKVKTPRIQAGGFRRIRAEKSSPTIANKKLPMWKRKNAPLPQINPVKPYSPETRNSVGDGPRFDNAPKPTRFEWPDDDMQDIKPFDLLPLDSSFDSISYSSKPLLTQEDEMRSTSNSSVFDDLRQLPSGKITKKSSDSSREKDYMNTSLDMEDLKSYVKEQKIRSDLADFDDDEDPDDPDYHPDVDISSKRKASVSPMAAKKAKISHEKENIVEVRASSTKVDHSKIISEVMKKYPHLMQKNKNVRLKIIAKNKNEEKEKTTPVVEKEKEKPKVLPVISPPIIKKDKPSGETESANVKKTRAGEQVWVCPSCPNSGEPVEFVLYYLYRKHMTDAHHKQFDVRECKHCGELYELPLQMTYHMQMAHAVMPPRSVVFPKCAQCSYIAYDKDIMGKHDSFHVAHPRHVQCVNCKLGFATPQNLKAHMQLAGHNGKNNLSFDCQYCTRQLNSASSLFVHCKTTHADDAIRDGMLSVDEGHLDAYEASSGSPEKMVEEKQASEEIESQLGSFDIVVLEDQQQFILGDQNAPTEESFMSLPALQDQQYGMTQGDIGSTDELVMVLTDHDYNDGNDESIISNDNSNIVVLYSHPVDGQQNQFITSQGNIRLNSETGMLEIHNDDVPISSQGESIEMIQKEIQSHVVNSAVDSTTETTQSLDVQTTETAVTEAEVPDIVPEDMEAVKKALNEESQPEVRIETELKPQEPANIDNLEGVQEDTTDFGAFKQVEEMQPEPMEIDEELKDTTQIGPIIETTNTTHTTTEEPTASIEPVVAEAPAPPEVISEQPPEKEETLQSTDIVSDAIILQQQPDVEVPQELLEPLANEATEVEKVANTEAEAILSPTSVINSELISQATEHKDEDYKTSASLSVSEQFPEEPMEVDGLLSETPVGLSPDETQVGLPSDETQVGLTTNETQVGLPADKSQVEVPADISKPEEKSVDQLTTVQDGQSQDDQVDTPQVDQIDTSQHSESQDDVVDTVITSEQITEKTAEDKCEDKPMEDAIVPATVQEKEATSVEKLTATETEPVALPSLEEQPVIEPAAEQTDQTQVVPNKESETASIPEIPMVEDPVSEPTETVQGLEEDKVDTVMEEKATSSTVDETSSLPESIEEPLTASSAVYETEDVDAQVDLLLEPPITTDPNAQLDKQREEGEKQKNEGISTLLNDWEDTDSQTSDTSKAAAVNKLIGDWDDE